MESVTNGTGPATAFEAVDGRNGDMDLMDILFSPVKNVATWLNHQDKHIPALEEASPRSQGGVALDPSEDDSEEDFFTASPKYDDSWTDEPIDPVQRITNYFPVFSPTPKKGGSTRTIIPATEVKKSAELIPIDVTQARSESSHMNPFEPMMKNIVNLFSPTPKKKQCSPLETINAASTPGKQQSHKRLDFDVDVVREMPVVAPREVASIEDLYKDAKRALERKMAAAGEINIQEYWEKARRVDTKVLVEIARNAAQKTVKKFEGDVSKIVDSVKEVEPKEVLAHAQASAQEVVAAVQRNAEAHPRQWTVIGVISFSILVQLIFFSGSFGAPSMRFWSSKAKENITERVGNLIQNEMGEMEAQQIMLGVRSVSPTKPVSAQDILSRLSASLEEPVDNSPDIIDRVRETIQMVRDNPRHHYDLVLSNSKFFVMDLWKQGRQLSTESFDEVTAL